MDVDIYTNADIIEAYEKCTSSQREQTPKRTEHAGSEPPGRQYYRMATVCLGILCFLLLTTVIVLFVYTQLVLKDESNLSFSPTWPEGWIRFGTKMYYISNVTKTWEESRQDCISRGADLIIINSQQEQHIILHKDAWIGLKKTDHEEVWKWVDGTPLTTSHWKVGEPNNDKEACAQNVAGKDPLMSWNDAGCYWKISWVCEKEA